MKYLNKSPTEVLNSVWGYESFKENQLEAVEDILKNDTDVLFLAPTSHGKALHKDTKIPLYRGGFTSMSDLHIGDEIISEDGSKTIVTNKFQPNIKGHYEIKFHNNITVKACKDHLWKYLCNGEYKIASTLEMYNDSLSKLVSIPFLNKSLNYQYKKLEENILEYITKISNNGISIDDKFIYNSIEVREEILKILLKHNLHYYYIENSSLDFINSCKLLLSTMGINSYIRTDYYDNKTRISYVLITRLENTNDISIKSMKTINDNPEDYYCITVDHSSKLFLITESFIVTHNSVVFQVPSIIMKGTTIVVTPLLSLMEDQIINASKKGINAVTFNSTMGKKEKKIVLDSLARQEVDILYIAPESLLNTELIDFLLTININFICAEEAHSISAWGSDFRPKYKQLGILREFFKVPFVAVTATADEKTVEDIKKVLKFEKSGFKYSEYKVSLDRQNIYYYIKPKIGNGYRQTIDIINGYDKETTGIIYCNTRKATEETARYLYTQGYKVRAYHAGLKPKDKDKILEDWLNKEVYIVVATIAFGMGIDMPNVRYVIHLSIPNTLEGYSQEGGRAGRDGELSKHYLLYDKKDAELAKWILKKSILNPTYLGVKLDKLNQVVQLANSKDCIRKRLLTYFGESYSKDNCASCSNCLNK